MMRAQGPRLARTRTLGRPARGEASDPATILVGLLCPIGDTLLATPALAALRQRFPSARIDALVYCANAGILDGNPHLNSRVIFDGASQSSVLARTVVAARRIRRSGYDLMVNLSPAASAVGMLAGVARQTHLDIPGLWWLLGTRDAAYQQRHAVEHYLHAIAPLIGSPRPALHPDERYPRLYLTHQHRQMARTLLRREEFTPTRPLVAMHAGGDGFRGRKRWSPRRFAAVGAHLAETFGAQVLLLGGKDDIPLAAEVASRMPGGAHVLAGQTTLAQTAALIERATLFIGNDSCLLHMAAALGVPAVGIYGPSSVAQFHPVGASNARVRVVHAELPCSPCFHFVGNDPPWLPNPCGSFACLKAISTEDVLAAAVALLRADDSVNAAARDGEISSCVREPVGHADRPPAACPAADDPLR